MIKSDSYKIGSNTNKEYKVDMIINIFVVTIIFMFAMITISII